MKTISKAYEQGYQAARNNKSLADNPYQESDSFHSEWRRGYLDYLNEWY